MPSVLAGADPEFSSYCRSLVVELLEHLSCVEQRVIGCDGRIKKLVASSEACKRISAVDGVGPITATAMVAAVGDAREFKNGRHLAAWLGLVPRQYSSGGKSKLYGISKRGDRYLRTLLIHGARSVLRYAAGKTDVQSRWLQDLIARRGYNRAAVALANKNARVIQALLSSGRDYAPVAA